MLGQAKTTAEGDGEEKREEEVRRGRMGNSGRMLNEEESVRRGVHSCSGNTKMIGFIFI